MAYIGNSPSTITTGRQFIYEFTATAGQTVFTGADDNNQTLDLLDAYENSVYLNGIRLVDSDDFTISGDTLTLTSAASLNDVLVVHTQDMINNINSYTRAEADARYVNYNGDVIAGDISISGYLKVDGDTFYVDDSDNTVGIGTTSPMVALNVHDTTNARIALTNTNTGQTFPAGVELLATGLDAYLQNRSNGNIIFTTNNTERARITSAGDVVINHNTNNAKLEFKDPSGSTGMMLQQVGTSGAPQMRFYDTSAGQERLRIDNSGNVGIGTSSPTNFGSGRTVVDVIGSTGAYILADDGTTQSRMGTEGGVGYLGTRTNHPLVITINNSERIRIDTSGNVGIGVTPEAWSSLYDTKALQIGAQASLSDINGDLHLSSNAYYDTTDARWEYINADYATKYTQIDGIHQWSTAASGTADAAISFSEAMRIDNSGNVGIGTANPVAELNVDGRIVIDDGARSNPSGGPSLVIDYQTTSDVQGRIRSRDWDGATWKNFTIEANDIYLMPAGNVGIGATNPTVKLDVLGSSGIVGRFQSSAGDMQLNIVSPNANNGIIAFGDASSYRASIKATTSDALAFQTSSSLAEAMRIRSSRAVSISTNGYVKNDAAQHLTIGDGTSASSASLSVVRGEGLSGGTGPTINLYHGPDSGTQVQHVIASYIGDLLISADNQNTHSSSTIDFHIDGAQVLSLASNGNLLMNNGAGINFAATGNGSGSVSSEILDDYEEGTWTPSFGGGGGNPTVTYTTQTGYYTKVGRMVHASAILSWSAKSGGSGTLTLRGLPYSGNSATRGVASVAYNDNGLTGSNGNILIHTNTSGNGYIYFMIPSSTFQTTTYMTTSAMGTGTSHFQIAITYMTT